MRLAGGAESWYSQDCSMGGWPTNGRIITIVEVLPKEWGIWTPHQAPQPWGRAPGGWAPQNIWLWSPVGLILGSPKGLGEIEASLLRGTCKISQALGPKAEAVIWKEPGSDLHADLGEFPGEAGGNWSSSTDTDTGSIHFGELILWCGHWCWQVTFWNPPSSLLASGPSPVLTHQPVGTSTGMSHAKQLTRQGNSPYLLPADRLP